MTKDEGIERARRAGKRYAMATFVVLASAFIVSSTWQIIAALFVSGAPLATAASASGIPSTPGTLRGGRTGTSRPCAAAVRELEVALDRARTRAAAAHDEAEASRLFEQAVPPDESFLAACRDGVDQDVAAAAARLRAAAEVAARRQADEIGRIQRDVDGVLPP